ncbi:peptidase inhibitor family I36 protein [Streptomyces sp. DH37]|uniref:peptidase inhibitor family I36 protein n=1 Tax=Streptomyces sp. DH37 TaxID=3040122 RepID=UPI002441408B|nr:peptidase inhibitor family I36 protein [Streptomyces sp. DH37]MDG9704135.1 peptidase inhibitor family I36 protein [Streptomyces sp. DH37]
MIGSRLRRALLSGAVLAGALVTLNAPAAQAHYSQCPSGHFCVWQHNSYEGRFFSSSTSTPNIGDYMNDRTTSVWNRSDRTVCMYRHENYGYPMGCYKAGGSTAALPIHNDELTSFRFE